MWVSLQAAMNGAQTGAFNAAAGSSASAYSLVFAGVFATMGLLLVAWLSLRGYEAWVKNELSLGDLAGAVMLALLVVVFAMFLIR